MRNIKQVLEAEQIEQQQYIESINFDDNENDGRELYFDDFNNYDEDLETEAIENEFCDNTGFCCGSSCRRWIQCQGL